MHYVVNLKQVCTMMHGQKNVEVFSLIKKLIPMSIVSLII